MTSKEDKDLDRLVDVIAERVRARLGGSLPVLQPPMSRGDCTSDSDDDCATCGACVVRRPWSVRAAEAAGATRIATRAASGAAPTEFNSMIDHTLLSPEATRDDVRKLCEEAKRYEFASVCVNTTWVPMCKQLLRGSKVAVCTVVGFPLGAMSPTAKAFEAREAVRQGADEVDMVINIGALKSGDVETVYEDICRVVKAARPALVKVILETSSLNDEQKVIGCTLSKLAGAAFVKTSTGFAKGGATVEDVALMRRVVGADMGVKASGGVRSAEDAARMATAGANRLGASASVAIVTGTATKQAGY